MKVMYIDTSSSFLYFGIAEEDKLLVEVKKRYDEELSKMAMVDIEKAFKKAKVEPKDIDKIIVVDGPGSFTGIRIGITIAKVYAYSLNKKITTISALEAMALSNDHSNYLVPMLDARRGFVYSAIYKKDLTTALAPVHIKLDVLKEELKKYDDVLVITNDDIDIDYQKESYSPDILKIITKFKDKKSINPHAVNPNYLKLTEAEEKLK
ncbi:MAG: tRNA (adenosine(37)-N6)-threonylcarbamoyltransferase complex dimerization subunit type 1 TsaB [Bacilli bacterium]|nr:tRNA (adenosine(37)-N6)-threonylcarbamoyltransferase complex dimerization subunit type 1 TsaB [Bacilli bacterium]